MSKSTIKNIGRTVLSIFIHNIKLISFVVFFTFSSISFGVESLSDDEFKNWNSNEIELEKCSMSNQIGNNDCINKEYKASEAELNRLYKDLTRSLEIQVY